MAIDKFDPKTVDLFFRTPYNYDRDAASQESGLECTEPSKAQQNFRDECDINTIVRQFGLTGELPNTVRIPTYGDFSGVDDYRTALHAVMAADEAFMALPADIRAKFANSPEAFVDFCSDPANKDELIKMGLAKEIELDPVASATGQQTSPKDASGDDSASK